jgi:small-conductance mechanosensitive channel
LIRTRVRRVLGLVAAVYWLYLVLRIFLVSDAVVGTLKRIVYARLEIGSFSLSLFQVIAGIFTVWLAFAISRFIRFLLEEDVYPHVRLPRGLGNALATIVHYTILVIGFAIAMATLGFPMTQLTILTGAFGVGLGFGLQTIINNFFSGIIVLAERPIQVGDVIEMDNIVGTVTRIGIRATIMRTSAGSEIILPNARLVAERVINWTLSDRTRGFDIPINIDSATAPPEIPPERIIEILQQTAAAHPGVAQQPSPRADFTATSPVAMTFTLYVWTTRIEDWQQVRSGVFLALRAALLKENIHLR